MLPSDRSNILVADLKNALQGRRIISIEKRFYPAEDDQSACQADYAAFFLDDGSEVVLLDENGFPPMCEVEKPAQIISKNN